MAKQYTILAVDDESDVLFLVKTVLQGEGYRVLTASGGQDALARRATRGPILFLLDVIMPGMDGFAVGRERYLIFGVMRAVWQAPCRNLSTRASRSHIMEKSE